MTVVPSLISQPAVPNHLRRTWPLFSGLAELCPAKVQVMLARSTKDAVTNRMGSPRMATISHERSYGGLRGQCEVGLSRFAPVGKVGEGAEDRLSKYPLTPSLREMRSDIGNVVVGEGEGRARIGEML